MLNIKYNSVEELGMWDDLLGAMNLIPNDYRSQNHSQFLREIEGRVYELKQKLGLVKRHDEATHFRTFGICLPFPLPMDGDWARIQCGVDGQPNYIFGLDGLSEFYEAGAGIYSRDATGRPQESLQDWVDWYQREKKERIGVFKTIGEIKTLVVRRLSL